MTDDDLAAIEALFNKVKIHFEGAPTSASPPSPSPTCSPTG